MTPGYEYQLRPRCGHPLVLTLTDAATVAAILAYPAARDQFEVYRRPVGDWAPYTPDNPRGEHGP